MKLPKIEISLKYTGALKSELQMLSGVTDTVQVLRQMVNKDTIEFTEEVVLLCLNRNMKVIGYYKLSSGGCSASLIDTKVIAIIALNCAASGVILCHNHPGGSLKPSPQDKNATAKTKGALELIDVTLHDHIILTDESYYSMSDHGEL